MKNTEDKNKEQLEAIEDQKEEQLDTINKQGKNS